MFDQWKGMCHSCRGVGGGRGGGEAALDRLHPPCVPGLQDSISVCIGWQERAVFFL